MASERQEYNEDTPWWGEHVHRYYMSFPWIKDHSRILDIACGNGFGSYILSKKTGGEVIGADISADTIADCSKRFQKENLKFREMDGTNIPYPDEYFDTVVSFETIEHTTEYRKMLKEFARVLKKDGTVIISTPNFIVNSPEGMVTNPYHTQEFTYEELKAILTEVFDQVKISGQEYARYKNLSLRNSIGKWIENILYLRGFRKIPLSIQDLIMRILIKKNMYPSTEDYRLTDNPGELLKCKTFFVVCRRK
jgi:ubiquinone/menaquinone biosynthesis C-methylase UbiE